MDIVGYKWGVIFIKKYIFYTFIFCVFSLKALNDCVRLPIFSQFFRVFGERLYQGYKGAQYCSSLITKMAEEVVRDYDGWYWKEYTPCLICQNPEGIRFNGGDFFKHMNTSQSSNRLYNWLFGERYKHSCWNLTSEATDDPVTSEDLSDMKQALLKESPFGFVAKACYVARKYGNPFLS